MLVFDDMACDVNVSSAARAVGYFEICEYLPLSVEKCSSTGIESELEWAFQWKMPAHRLLKCQIL